MLLFEQIYIVVHTTGLTDDQCENIVAVTDNYDLACGYLEEYVSGLKDDPDYYYDMDEVSIRSYSLNELDPQHAKAKAINPGGVLDNELPVYQADIYDSKWVKISEQ